MNKDNLFWGVVFLMAAIYILMRSVGMAPDVSIVRIIIGLLCITGFIKAAIDLEFGGMLFSLAILFIVFRRYIGLESMSSWSILMAALFGTIGLNMLLEIMPLHIVTAKEQNVMESSLSDSRSSMRDRWAKIRTLPERAKAFTIQICKGNILC